MCLTFQQLQKAQREGHSLSDHPVSEIVPRQCQTPGDEVGMATGEDMGPVLSASATANENQDPGMLP